MSLKILSQQQIDHMCTKPELYNWADICSRYYIEEHFQIFEKHINEYDKFGCWNCISSYQTLSEDIIEKYADKLNWKYISYYQDLSEEFMEKYNYRISWKGISRYQKLSKDFIVKFLDKVDFFHLLLNKSIPEDTKTYIRMFI